MNAVIEKLLWAMVPLLLSAVTYLWSTVHTTKEQVQALKIEAELARERVRHDVLHQATANRERIAVLEERVNKLENKK